MEFMRRVKGAGGGEERSCCGSWPGCRRQEQARGGKAAQSLAAEADKGRRECRPRVTHVSGRCSVTYARWVLFTLGSKLDQYFFPPFFVGRLVAFVLCCTRWPVSYIVLKGKIGVECSPCFTGKTKKGEQGFLVK